MQDHLGGCRRIQAAHRHGGGRPGAGGQRVDHPVGAAGGVIVVADRHARACRRAGQGLQVHLIVRGRSRGGRRRPGAAGQRLGQRHIALGRLAGVVPDRDARACRRAGHRAQHHAVTARCGGGRVQAATGAVDPAQAGPAVPAAARAAGQTRRPQQPPEQGRWQPPASWAVRHGRTAERRSSLPASSRTWPPATLSIRLVNAQIDTVRAKAPRAVGTPLPRPYSVCHVGRGSAARERR
jgi:hypothetical protein